MPAKCCHIPQTGSESALRRARKPSSYKNSCGSVKPCLLLMASPRVLSVCLSVRHDAELPPGPRCALWGRCAAESHCQLFQTTALFLTVSRAINVGSSGFVLLNTRLPSFPSCCQNSELRYNFSFSCFLPSSVRMLLCTALCSLGLHHVDIGGLELPRCISLAEGLGAF